MTTDDAGQTERHLSGMNVDRELDESAEAGTATGSRSAARSESRSAARSEMRDEVEQEIELGTDPSIVGDRDEPDLPVRTGLDQPASDAQLPPSDGQLPLSDGQLPLGDGHLPLGESDIEDRLRAAERVQHRDAGEPDAALG